MHEARSTIQLSTLALTGLLLRSLRPALVWPCPCTAVGSTARKRISLQVDMSAPTSLDVAEVCKAATRELAAREEVHCCTAGVGGSVQISSDGGAKEEFVGALLQEMRGQLGDGFGRKANGAEDKWVFDTLRRQTFWRQAWHYNRQGADRHWTSWAEAPNVAAGTAASAAPETLVDLLLVVDLALPFTAEELELLPPFEDLEGIDLEVLEACLQEFATKLQRQSPTNQLESIRQLKALVAGMRGNRRDLVRALTNLGNDSRNRATVRVLCIVHTGREHLSSDKEIAALTAHGVECTVIPATSASICASLQSDAEFDAVHYIGHGEPHGLCGNRPNSQEERVLDPELFFVLLQEHRSLKLVFLNACWSQESVERVPANVMRALHAMVITCCGPIADSSAVSFAALFYSNWVPVWQHPVAVSLAFQQTMASLCGCPMNLQAPPREQHTGVASPTVHAAKPAAVAKPAEDLSKDVCPHLYSALAQMTTKQLKSKSTKSELKSKSTKSELMMAVLETCRRRQHAATSGSQAMLASGFISATNTAILKNSAAVDSEWAAFWSTR